MPLILVSPYVVKQPSYLFDFVPSSDPMVLTMKASSGLLDTSFLQAVQPEPLMINALPNATAGIFIQQQSTLSIPSASSTSSGVFVQMSSNVSMSADSPHDIVFYQRVSTVGLNAIKPR